jgi:hypothetical protein
MKRILVFALTFYSIISYSQKVGINTTSPQATLDIVGEPTNVSSLDGIITPRLTGNELNQKSYTSQQNGAIVYVTAARTNADNGQCSQVNQLGYYYFNGTIWSPISNNTYGDIKTGLQSGDHGGWIKLDGRAKSSLTATQQIQATAIGIGDYIPDASYCTLMQIGTGLGTVSGSNTITLAQNQLPNITLGGNTSAVSAGTPDGDISSTSAGTPSGSISSTSAGTPSGSISVANTTATMQSTGNHNHSPNYASSFLVYGTGYGYTSNSGGMGVGQNSTTNSTGAHTHTMNAHNHTATFTGSSMSNHTHTFTGSSLSNHTHSFTGIALGSHSHTISTNSINGGVTQQSIDITPQKLCVNIFIYLGY